MGSREGNVYVDLTPTLGGKEAVSDRKSAQGKHIKTDWKRNNGSEEIMEYYRKYDEALWKTKKQ